MVLWRQRRRGKRWRVLEGATHNWGSLAYPQGVVATVCVGTEKKVKKSTAPHRQKSKLSNVTIREAKKVNNYVGDVRRVCTCHQQYVSNLFFL